LLHGKDYTVKPPSESDEFYMAFFQESLHFLPDSRSTDEKNNAVIKQGVLSTNLKRQKIWRGSHFPPDSYNKELA
jgi:hypothetical protein